MYILLSISLNELKYIFWWMVHAIIRGLFGSFHFQYHWFGHYLKKFFFCIWPFISFPFLYKHFSTQWHLTISDIIHSVWSTCLFLAQFKRRNAKKSILQHSKCLNSNYYIKLMKLIFTYHYFSEYKTFCPHCKLL